MIIRANKRMLITMPSEVVDWLTEHKEEYGIAKSNLIEHLLTIHINTIKYLKERKAIEKYYDTLNEQGTYANAQTTRAKAEIKKQRR